MQVAPAADGSARGLRYLDDGDTVQVGSRYTLLEYTLVGRRLVGRTIANGYDAQPELRLDDIVVFGVTAAPAGAPRLDGRPLAPAQYAYEPATRRLVFAALGVPATGPFVLTW